MACSLQAPPCCLDPIREYHAKLFSVTDQLYYIQGFFKSLFTSGFEESSRPRSPRTAELDQVDITFDDRNITRAGAYTTYADW